MKKISALLPENSTTTVVTPILAFLSSMVISCFVVFIPQITHWYSTDYMISHMYIIGMIGQSLIDIPAIILYLFLRKKLNPENKPSCNPRNHIRGILVGSACAIVLACIRLLISGHLMNSRFMGGVIAFTQSLDLAYPWNIFASAFNILAYGPGEALYVSYFILAFDNKLGNKRLISPGVLITSAFWAVPHIVNIVFFGTSEISNIIVMFFMGIITGVILKKTRSIIAPMVFWTLVNGTSI